MSCAFRNIVDALETLVLGLLEDMVKKAVTAPPCMANNMVGAMIGQLANSIQDTLKDILGGLDDLLDFPSPIEEPSQGGVEGLNIIEDIVILGKVLSYKKIPLKEKLDHKNIALDINGKKFTDGFSLNVGNPHIVFFVKDCFENDLKILGPKIETHELFPDRTNVTFAQIDDENNITVNVWERGAGLTKACGTAACATAMAAFIKKLTKNNINIKFEEGSLNIKIDSDLNIFMRGPVSEIKHTKLEI